jgi:hypothetical protein
MSSPCVNARRAQQRILAAHAANEIDEFSTDAAGRRGGATSTAITSEMLRDASEGGSQAICPPSGISIHSI